MTRDQIDNIRRDMERAKENYSLRPTMINIYLRGGECVCCDMKTGDMIIFSNNHDTVRIANNDTLFVQYVNYASIDKMAVSYGRV